MKPPNRLARLGVLGPRVRRLGARVAYRHSIIHRYDHITRALTWQMLVMDLPSWQASLAEASVDADRDMPS